MNINVGSVDRYVRAVAGIALIVYTVASMPTMLGFLLAAVGMVLLSTAVASACPIYALLGLSTHRHPRPQ